VRARADTRSLVALFAATGAELCGLFLFAPLLLFQLQARGLDGAATGLFAALNWAGVLLGAPFAGAAVRRLGTARALLLSGAVPALALAGIQLGQALPLWALLNLVAGVAAALRWVLSEALVARLAPPAHRGRVMGLFATMVGGTFMAGPALASALLARGATPAQAGWVAVALAAAGVLLLLGVRVPELAAAPPGRAAQAAGTGLARALSGARALGRTLRAAPVVMASGCVGGFFEAGLSGALPLWGLSLGWSTAAAALLVTLSGLGSTLAAAPAGELADRWGHQRLRRGCLVLCLGGALLLPAVALPGADWLAWPLAAAWGAAGSALYTLAMVEIGRRHAGDDPAGGSGQALVDSTGVLVLAYTAGSMVAPPLAGLMIDHAPRHGLAALLAAVALAGLWALRTRHG